LRRPRKFAITPRIAYTLGKMTHAETLGVALGEPPLKIGGLAISGRAFLAPMAGVTDAAMRRIAERHGAGATFSEMITAAGVSRGDRETRLRLAGAREPQTAPRVVQIAARDPEGIALAARHAADTGAGWIDINMGCPCKRVTGGLAGSALMRDLDQASRLIAATVSAIDIPVSVKMRLGWDHASLNAPELARRAEAEGAKLVTVHGRTRQQFYNGAADWAAIKAVKDAVRIPVVANGDCDSPHAAREMLRLSNADAVMVGRAAIGRPWLVGDIAHYLAAGRLRPPPSREERGALALEHLESLIAAMGQGPGLRHARKHLAAYADHAGVGKREEERAPRRALVVSDEPREVRRLIERLFAIPEREEAA
jgi:nifR3 family TIM-barrel protein